MRKPGKLVAIDCGAGKGRHSLYLARKGHEVHAVDFTPGALGHLREKLKSEKKATASNVITHEMDLAQRDWQALPSADLVIASYLLQDIPPEARETFLGNMQEKTAKGGYNVIFAKGKPGPDGADNLISEKELREKYRDWKIIRCQSTQDKRKPATRIAFIARK